MRYQKRSINCVAPAVNHAWQLMTSKKLLKKIKNPACLLAFLFWGGGGGVFTTCRYQQDATDQMTQMFFLLHFSRQRDEDIKSWILPLKDLMQFTTVAGL